MEESSVCCTSENSKAMCCSSASSGDDDRVEELSTSLSSQLKIDTINGAERYYIEEAEEEEEEDEDEDEDDLSEEALLAQMGYVKSDPVRDSEGEEENVSEDSILVKNKAHKQEPTAELNLVSALRGSREKEGRPAEECRVSWAPDVYDPPCTSDDHFAASRNERHRSEQKGKGVSGRNRQKGGGSEGGGAKAAGGSKSKRKAEKKHKKHVHKYSDPS